jgi:hypothetical protein
MREALLVVSLDAGGRVRRVARLAPRGLFVDRGAKWIIEVPAGLTAPPVGAVLHARLLPRPILAACPGL